MTNAQLAEELLRILKTKLGFDPLVQAPYALPTSEAKKIYCKAKDIEVKIQDTNTKPIFQFIKDRLITEYEYKKVNELIQILNAKKLASENSDLEKYKRLIAINGSLYN